MTADNPAPPVRPAVAAAPDAVEREERCIVLFAADSGSRASGLPSSDSDWDVRFVYARPSDWHLSLRPGRDVIEHARPGDLDVSGRDARKAISVLLGRNVVLREWPRATITCREEPDADAGLRRLADRLPARSAARHSRSLALSIRGRHPGGDGPARPKKYLYAVRPALALRWLGENPAGGPPLDLPALLAGTTQRDDESRELDVLPRRKPPPSELGEGSRLPAPDTMIAGGVALAAAGADGLPHPAETESMRAEGEALFRRCIALADGRAAECDGCR